MTKAALKLFTSLFLLALSPFPVSAQVLRDKVKCTFAFQELKLPTNRWESFMQHCMSHSIAKTDATNATSQNLSIYDIRGVKTGMTNDQLPVEFRNWKFGPSGNVSGTLEKSTCVPHFGDQNCFIIMFSPESEEKTPRVYQVLLTGLDLGTVQFRDNLIDVFINKFGEPSQRSTYSSGAPMAAWGTPSDFLSQGRIGPLGLGAVTPVMLFKDASLYRDRGVTKPFVVVYTYSRTCGPVCGAAPLIPNTADIVLIDPVRALRHWDIMENASQRNTERRKEQELQSMQKRF
jgi:hypothetical protein